MRDNSASGSTGPKASVSISEAKASVRMFKPPGRPFTPFNVRK